MAEFDPAAFLGGASAPPEERSNDFDPAAFLADDKGGFDPAAFLADKPQAEGPIASNVRAAAHGIIPAAGAVLGGAAGGALVGGPIGGLVGGVVGGIAGGMGASYLQDKAQENFPSIDDRAQMEADKAKYPISTQVSEMAAFAGNPGQLAGSMVARGVQGAMLGGLDVAQQAYEKGSVDPTQALTSAAFGVVFPHGNKVTQAVSDKVGAAVGKYVPGRPGRAPNPEAAQSHSDVGDTEVSLEESSLSAGTPVPPTTAEETTIGNPQSAPERSAQDYRKQTPLGMPEQNYQPTQGDMDLATRAALDHANPEQAQTPPVDTAPPQQQQPQQVEPQPAMPAPSVEAAFPKPGEPVAVGQNDAAPMPAKAADAIRKSIARNANKQGPVLGDGTRANPKKGQEPEMPALKGETPINDSITPAQKVAGNYPKARTTDFGKPVRVETHEGDTRRSHPDAPEPWEVKSPYEYGYFGKTMGPDKDPIDFARPKEGSPELGDKHFIIDQKDANTGKYDEPKVFTYYKDKDTAIDAYHRGFSDGKGPDRLHDITEVSRADLVKFLNKHTTKPPSKPYGQPIAKSVKERAVVQDAVAKLRAKGDEEGAAKLLSAPEEKLAAAIEGKRTRKYGVESKTGKSVSYPVEGLPGSTANTKVLADARARGHKAVSDWFENSKPPSQMDMSQETNGELLDRLKMTKEQGNPEGWTKGPSVRPREWLLHREAKSLLAKPTPANIKKFREAERDLRGNEQDVENYRHGNRIEADIKMGRQAGDDAVAGAEAKLHQPGRNDIEDAMIEAIDAKKTTPTKSDYWDGLAQRTLDRNRMTKKDRKLFDTPHEEAEAMVKPTEIKSKADMKRPGDKTVDVEDSSLAAIDTKAISKTALRKAEAERLAGQKPKAANVPSEEKKTTGKSLNIKDFDTAKLVEMSNQAKNKKLGLEALPAERDPEMSKPARDLYEHFVRDQKASGDINKVKSDFARMLQSLRTRSTPKSYRAMELRTPHDEYIQSLSEDLHKISQEDRNHWIALAQKIAAMPKELTAPDVMERIYHARDADSAHTSVPGRQPGKTNIESLPPDIKALYDEHLKPVLDDNDKFVANIRRIDPERIGPDVLHHISHITAGDTSQYNMLKSHDDPTAPAYNGLSVNASAAKDRKFFALEKVSGPSPEPVGSRAVIQPDEAGTIKWKNRNREMVKGLKIPFEDGKTVKVGGNEYIMRNATAKEIMDHARGGDGTNKPMKYYTNAGFAASVAHAQLGSMARHLAELARISETPQFKKLTTTNPDKAKERGWEQSNLPNFKGTFMHPEMKAIFDDFAGHPQNAYRELNSAITKMLFWMPTAHINNVAMHWLVGRGWDNFSVPKNVRMVFQDIPKAIKSVVNQDEFQMEMRRNGAGTIFGSVITSGMMDRLAKGFKMEMERNPSQWGPIADTIGVPLKALGKAVYDTSKHVMWAGNDVFLTQRVMELQRKGKSIREAIIEAERDIPNYRVPHVVGGRGGKGRFMSEVLADPAITSFGRYHYGMWNSYANIVKDAISKNSTMGDRVDAAGKLLTMGMIAMVVYPALDKVAKLATGNDEATAQRRGPLSIPHHVGAALEGKEDIMSGARSSLTVPPLVSTILETLFNKDFRGKPIVEPGDVRDAYVNKNPAAAARVVTQEAEHAARGLVSPYSTFANSYKKQNDASVSGAAKGLGGAIRDQAIDVKNPSDKAIKYERTSPIKTFRDANTRFRQGGSGPAEALIDKVFGK